MIVEFIGSTGAGKTRLAAEVRCKLAQKTRATTPIDLITQPFNPRKISNMTARNLLQDFIAWPFFVRRFNQNKAFTVFALRTLKQNSTHSLFTLNYVRSIIRRIGMYEMARRHSSEQTILVDEGTVLSAHLLFVYTSAGYLKKDIETFANLVPLPDLLVHVRAPLDCLVQRAVQRNDAPRELRFENRKQIERCVSRAANMFDQLAGTRKIRNRVLDVANPRCSDNTRSALADHIVDYILNFESNQEQHPKPASPESSQTLVEDKHVT